MSKEDHLLDEYVMRYQEMVIRNAYMYVKDYYVAEDICQETFIRFARNMELIPDTKVIAWLLRVSERIALDHLRKGNRRKTALGLEEYEEILEDTRYMDVSGMIIQKEELKNRKRVLDRLGEAHPLWYEAILMSCLENMDNKTIGAELGVTPALVSKWKERGKRWLREEYEKQEEQQL